MTRAKAYDPTKCKDCGQRLLDRGRPTRCHIDWTMHPRPSPITATRADTGRCIPTVGQVRWVLVCALRHLAEARKRKAPVKRAIEGIDNARAVEIIRRALKGHPKSREVSRFTWNAARSLANATDLVPAKAFYNTPRWVL